MVGMVDQPSPRVAQERRDGRPAISEVVGDWGVLAHPGGNGIMTVLLLVWWRRGEKSEGPSEDWAAAVRDVLWVLKGLLSAAKNKYATPIHTLDTALITAVTAIRKRKAAGREDESPPKRARNT
ncbi:hypothetical protein B0H14DRAFT_3493682 [Mycena olivaceomarginata]|nr:hypothetical protein B0H14DRAFT_3493682 [Mycena olivaceomarginata]